MRATDAFAQAQLRLQAAGCRYRIKEVARSPYVLVSRPIPRGGSSRLGGIGAMTSMSVGVWSSSSTTRPELQARVQKLFGTTSGLSLSQLSTPMPELRQQLLTRAEQVSALLMRQGELLANRKPDLLVKESLRNVISTLAYAVGFAYIAGLLPRDQPVGTRTRVVDEPYCEQLSE
jgi:hypothetical protein